MKNENLCLIGCGWLGKPLAEALIQDHFQVLATTTHDKAASDGISYINMDLNLRPIVSDNILKSDILIYTIPPLEQHVVKHFFDQIPENKKIIFTSSTSVYGKKLGHVDETTILDRDNSSSPLLVETENYLRSRFKFLTILRLGGLYGHERHPVFFLQGKSHLKSGEELLHLAHQSDCLNSITGVIKQNLWGETINIISDLRVPKKAYYSFIAEKLSLPLPQYDDSHADEKMTNISNEKSKKLLGINYLDPNEFCKSCE